MTALQLFIDSLIAEAIYTLVASDFSLIYFCLQVCSFYKITFDDGNAVLPVDLIVYNPEKESWERFKIQER